MLVYLRIRSQWFMSQRLLCDGKLRAATPERVSTHVNTQEHHVQAYDTMRYNVIRGTECTVQYLAIDQLSSFRLHWQSAIQRLDTVLLDLKLHSHQRRGIRA